MNYYISDLHLGHENVLRFDNRPFATIKENDETIIKNWNATINDDDTVYILGDISWYKPDDTAEIIKELKGNKILIRGNHDKISPLLGRCFKGVKEYLEIKEMVNEQPVKVILSHYPILCWNSQFRDTIHLYGHVHTTQQYDDTLAMYEYLREKESIPVRAYNVGCMISYMNYKPRTLEEILKAN